MPLSDSKQRKKNGYCAVLVHSFPKIFSLFIVGLCTFKLLQSPTLKAFLPVGSDLIGFFHTSCSIEGSSHIAELTFQKVGEKLLHYKKTLSRLLSEHMIDSTQLGKGS